MVNGYCDDRVTSFIQNSCAKADFPRYKNKYMGHGLEAEEEALRKSFCGVVRRKRASPRTGHR